MVEGDRVEGCKWWCTGALEPAMAVVPVPLQPMQAAALAAAGRSAAARAKAGAAPMQKGIANAPVGHKHCLWPGRPLPRPLAQPTSSTVVANSLGWLPMGGGTRAEEDGGGRRRGEGCCLVLIACNSRLWQAMHTIGTHCAHVAGSWNVGWIRGAPKSMLLSRTDTTPLASTRSWMCLQKM